MFQEATIRRVWHNEEWWFAVVGVVGVLTDSADPRQYIKKKRSRGPALGANWGTTCTPLALQAPDGKQRDHMTDLELIFTMPDEASTTEIARRSDVLGFDENRTSAKEGGKMAGSAEQAQSSGEVQGRPLISRRFKRQRQVFRLAWRCL